MKKLLCVLMLLTALSLCDCGADTPAATFCGTVVRVTDDALLCAQGGDAGGLYFVSRDGALADCADDALAPGTILEMDYNGNQLDSYPARIGGAQAVRLTAGDDRVGLYLAIIDALWNMDAALSDGARYLALDLSAAENLSAGERAAVAYLASCAYGVEPLEAGYDALCAQSYIEGGAFPGGILVTFSDMRFGDDSFTFSVRTWCSGTAAYFFTHCAAQLTDGVWGYTLGGAAVS
ncbi:MAG: hypothetical protein VB092_04320 [Oscillospiraceae bacterium]|nr:hypothetical protein [Oscillospiraceae bacterium]